MYINFTPLNKINRWLIFPLVSVLLVISCKKKDHKPESAIINGQSYQIVRIGNQLWTTVNYNGPGGVNYNEGPNDIVYGKYYTREEAQNIPLQDGWRLPSKADFEQLISNFPHKQEEDYIELSPEGVQQLMATTSWSQRNGNNRSGFNAMAVGEVYVNAAGGNRFSKRGTQTEFISTTNERTTSGGAVINATWSLYIGTREGTTPQQIDFIGGTNSVWNSDWYRYSVRFVKDVN